MNSSHQTIFAPATLVGKSGVAVIRVSGAHAFDVFSAFSISMSPEPNVLRLATLCDQNGDIIDQAMAVHFKGPASFTGEDVVEFHVHGSVAVINKVMNMLGRLPNFRIAEPGEFARRAFLNGKMDLTMAEGLASLIESETEMQRKIALRQYSGEQNQLYSSWRNTIIAILARFEAFIDFPDEDIPKAEVAQALADLGAIKAQIDAHIAQSNVAEVVRRGIHIAIVGAPNAGKSTLINALAKRDIAIVSNIPGTTRDVLEARIDIDGYECVFYDTAGIRDTEDAIEAEGIVRARRAIDAADMVIKLINSEANSNNLQDLAINPSYIFYTHKDLAEAPPGETAVNLKDDNDIKLLYNILSEAVKTRFAITNEPLLVSMRHKNSLSNASGYIAMVSEYHSLEVISQHTREAANALGEILGRIDLEEVLDKIFSSFCIGK